ncbi:MAG: flagellar motor protein MotB [Bdellovibrionales bacterium]
MSDESGGKDQPIIIKKIVKGGGHHGGAWKVAYADFVTAMMAFFLLLWLLNVTTEEQKNAISNYFDPTHPRVSESTSGAGGVMGGLSVNVEGAMVSTVQPITPPPTQQSTMNAARANAEPQNLKSAIEEAEEELRAQEEKELDDIKEKIEQAIQQSPELAALAENLMIDMTPEGLRIQVIDQEGKPMFPSGSARMFEKTRALMEQVAKIIQAVPNEISVRGHTDSIPFGKGADYTNWELSTDRANASRRVLEQADIPTERLNNVVGKADTEHLLPDDPSSARNRRISIILLREELTDPEGYKKRAEALAKKKVQESDAPPVIGPIELNGEKPAPILDPALPKPKTGTFERTDGDVEFP